MDRPRLIALDMDGTLLDSRERTTQRGEAAIRALSARGVTVVLATGRPLRMTRSFVHDLDLEYGIVFNGAARYFAPTESVVYHHGLDRETSLDVIERLRERLPGVCLGLETAHGWYLDTAFEERRRAHPRLAQLTPPDGVGEIETFVRTETVKIFARHGELGADVMASALDGLEVYTTWTKRELLEVMHPAVNKRKALEQLALTLGIPQAETAAFGDGQNDIELLAWAGQGIAVANACAEALEAADEVTLSNEEDGVATVLERWL